MNYARCTTPLGGGVVLGWGQDDNFAPIAAGELVVCLDTYEITSFNPDEVEIDYHTFDIRDLVK